MQCNFYTHIGLLAEAIKYRNQRELPNQTKINPHEHVKANTLRSGTQLGDALMMKKTIQEDKKNR